MLALITAAIIGLGIVIYRAGFAAGQLKGFRTGLYMGQGLEVDKQRQLSEIRINEVRKQTDDFVRQNQSAAEAYREQTACATAMAAARNQENRTAN